MSYTINLSIIDDSGDALTVVEKTCWYYANGGTWIERDGRHILSMGGSGTSGMLRFKSSTGEIFALAVGVHNYAVWCDLLVDMRNEDTIVRVHPTYYDNGPRGQMLWNHLRRLEKTTAMGRTLTIDFFRNDSHDLFASLTSTISTMHDEPNVDEPVLLSKDSDSDSYIQVQAISDLPQSMRIEGKEFRMIKRVLDAIGEPGAIEVFHRHVITDLWLPFFGGSLPFGLKPGALKRFQNTQMSCLAKGVNLERGGHCHLSDDDLDEDEHPKSLKFVSDLGTGGFSTVYKVLGEKEYALKRIDRGRKFDDTLIAMRYFDSELRILKKITEEKARHFVTLVGSYTSPRWVGLLMSPVADSTLQEFMKDSEKSGKKEAKKLLWKFFGCLASAVADLHFHLGVRHKDIKPSNILVKATKVLITDFGMALDWSASGNTTTYEDLRKTRLYCAPEVENEDAKRSSADIWSLGCVYLEMMTVLKGKSIKSIRPFFMSKGSEHGYYYASQKGIDGWVKMLRESQVTDLDFENIPLEWIEEMLQHQEGLRPDARRLRNLILAVPAHSSVVLYCDQCKQAQK